MYFTNPRRNRPLYKKILPLRKNVQNSKKLLNFKHKKWKKFQYFILKNQKKKFYNPISYFLSNFKNFFKKKFKYNLQNKQRLSFSYGKLKKNYLKKSVKLALYTSKRVNTQAAILFIEKLETRLDTALYKTYFLPSFNSARQLILHKKIYVNNKIVQQNSYTLKKGDRVSFDSSIFNFISSNVLKSKIWPIPPKRFNINYKTLQILVIEDIRCKNYFLNYLFWVDFYSFIKFYER